jgi:hypothetical protein
VSENPFRYTDHHASILPPSHGNAVANLLPVCPQPFFHA